MTVTPASSLSLRGRDVLSVADLRAPEVERVFATAEALKMEFRTTRPHAGPPLRVRPQRGDRRSGAGAGRRLGRAARVRERPIRTRGRHERRLHRLLDL